MKQKDH